MKEKPRKETPLTQDVLNYLLQVGIKAWRQNVAAIKIGRRFIRFGVPGQSDIMGYLPPNGRILAVETKRVGEVLTDEQRDFLADVNASGGLGLVVYHLDELDKALRDGGYLPE